MAQAPSGRAPQTAAQWAGQLKQRQEQAAADVTVPVGAIAGAVMELDRSMVGLEQQVQLLYEVLAAITRAAETDAVEAPKRATEGSPLSMQLLTLNDRLANAVGTLIELRKRIEL